ncbi:MAG: M1 family peptidase, partial [Flavobacteriales bacterium]|nr:M1 family peptidase [Flavobacteriales bacterium]
MKKLLTFAFSLITIVLCGQQSYFQQEVNYSIDVELNDEDHELDGFIEMEYINNSPDELSFIWMHIWPNAYGDRNSALAKQQYRDGRMFMFYTMQKNLGGIDSLDFKVDGATAKWSYHPEHTDIAKIELSQPLAPGGKVVISTPFRVDLPSGAISRLGHIGDSYQITQWYPKPAVYDKDGWHEMPYLNQGEFYSEYGSFDVSITLPKNYVLGATGDRYDSPEEEAFMDSLAQATAELDEFPDDMSFPESSKEKKTVRFKQDRVHDFAWFADKRWHVLKGEVELPHSGRKVTTWALFTPREADLWKKSIEYLNDGTYYYSLWNGDYPYNHVTAVDGTISAGGGMEYPNITVI